MKGNSCVSVVGLLFIKCSGGDVIGVSVGSPGGSRVATVVLVRDSPKGVEDLSRISRCDEDDACPLCS